MDKSNSMKKICAQLHDGRLCQKIYNDPTPTLRNKLNLLINEQQTN